MRFARFRGLVCSGALIDLQLLEVSLVAEPMQPKARVHAVEGR